MGYYYVDVWVIIAYIGNISRTKSKRGYMIIKMLKEKFVLVDGLHLERFVKDAEYSVRDSVGSRLVNNGEAQFIREAT